MFFFSNGYISSQELVLGRLSSSCNNSFRSVHCTLSDLLVFKIFKVLVSGFVF